MNFCLLAEKSELDTRNWITLMDQKDEFFFQSLKNRFSVIDLKIIYFWEPGCL